MFGVLLLLHVLGATVWVGGHLVLTLSVLPGALRARDVAPIMRFEHAFERVGIPALVIQVATGLWLATHWQPAPAAWFDFSDPVGRVIGVKLILLASTVGLAIDARLRLIPRLTPERLGALAWHIIAVTVLAIGFVIVGVSFRTTWFF